jgi:hypothetical protein
LEIKKKKKKIKGESSGNLPWELQDLLQGPPLRKTIRKCTFSEKPKEIIQK